MMALPDLELSESDSPRSEPEEVGRSPVAFLTKMLSLIPESPRPGEGPGAFSPAQRLLRSGSWQSLTSPSPPVSPSVLINIWRAKLEEPADPVKEVGSTSSGSRLPDAPRATSLVDGMRNRLRLPTLRSAKASLSGAPSTASTPSCLSVRSEVSEDLEAASRRRGQAATLGAAPKTVPRAAAKLRRSGTATRFERHASLPDPPRETLRVPCDPAARSVSPRPASEASTDAGSTAETPEGPASRRPRRSATERLRGAVSASKLLRPGSAATPPRSRSGSRPRSRSRSNSFSPPNPEGLNVYSRELAQGDALRQLCESIGPAMPLRDLAGSLLSPLLAPDGGEMFAREQISEAVEAVLSGRTGLEVKEAPELLLEVAAVLATDTGLRFGSVAGQVLWQHRGLKIFMRDPQQRALVEDTRWAQDFPVNLGGEEILKSVDLAFKEASSDDGHMRFAGWQKVVRTIEANPVLQARLKKTDADRLFWTACKRSAAPPGRMTRRDFRKLLLELSEAMSVHPFMVFLTVCSAAPFLAELQEKREKERQESMGRRSTGGTDTDPTEVTSIATDATVTSVAADATVDHVATV